MDENRERISGHSLVPQPFRVELCSCSWTLCCRSYCPRRQLRHSPALQGHERPGRPRRSDFAERRHNNAARRKRVTSHSVGTRSERLNAQTELLCDLSNASNAPVVGAPTPGSRAEIAVTADAFSADHASPPRGSPGAALRSLASRSRSGEEADADEHVLEEEQLPYTHVEAGEPDGVVRIDPPRPDEQDRQGAEVSDHE